VDYRKEIINELIPYFETDDRYHLICCDMGFGAIDEFISMFPDRFTNGGIMEQGIVGIGAGAAMTGKIPIIYTIGNFLCFRALEQIRNDVLLHGLNVKFIGTGAENYFDFLGPSHTCDKDDKKIFDIIGLDVSDPYVNPTKYELFDKFCLKNNILMDMDTMWHIDIEDFEESDADKEDRWVKLVNDFMMSEKAGYIRV